MTDGTPYKFVTCEICARAFPPESERVLHLGADRFRCKECDSSPYPEDWGWDDDDDSYGNCPECGDFVDIDGCCHNAVCDYDCGD